MLSAFLRILQLAAAITSAEVPPERATSAALAIVSTAGEYPPALVAAVAFGESRFQPDAKSAPVVKMRCDASGCREVTYWDCGPMQVRTSSPSRCRRLRTDARYGYAAGVQRLRDARDFCERRGDATLACAIAGYQGGPEGVAAYRRGVRWTTEKRQALLERAAEIHARAGWSVSDA
jgi:hypothetical protein